MKAFAIALLFSAAGCSAADSNKELSAELRLLDITQLAISESDTTLAIEGRDDSDTVVASLVLRRGTFEMTVDERGQVSGRQLFVDVRGATSQHESEGDAPLLLPYPRDIQISSFLVDPAVAVALARWGVTLNEATRPHGAESVEAGEAAYLHSCQNGTELFTDYSGYAGCQTSTFTGCTATKKMKFEKGVFIFMDPMGNPFEAAETGEWRCCDGTSQFAERACTWPNTMTSCGLAGSGGCAVCWTQAYNSLDPFCDIVQAQGQCRHDYCQ